MLQLSGLTPCYPARCIIASGSAAPGSPLAGSMASGVDRLAVRAPSRPEILDDLASLLVAHLDKLIIEGPVLPFGNHRAEIPAEVLPESLIGEAISIKLQPPDKPVWIIDRPVPADDRVECDLVRHLEVFLPVVRDVGGPVR